jgi:GNAT superfamily N-acetyltransferase
MSIAVSQVVGRLRRPLGRIRELQRRVLCRRELVIYRGDFTPPPARPASPAGFTLALVSFDALSTPKRREELAALGSPPAYAAEKWNRGEICCALLRGEEIVGVQWAAKSPTYVPEIGREVVATGERWYLHDLMLAESARGKGLAAPLVVFALAEIAARGGRGIFTLVESENFLSHRAMQRSGFKHSGLVQFMRVGLWSWLRYLGFDPEARGFLGA